MIRNKDCNGYLIDGFPRDTPQGEQFEKTVSATFPNFFLCKIFVEVLYCT